MALALFRLIAAVARTEVLSNTLGAFTLLLVVTLGGFIVAKGIMFFCLICSEKWPDEVGKLGSKLALF